MIIRSNNKVLKDVPVSKEVLTGDYRSLARLISMVENEHPLSREMLLALKPDYNIPMIGITGPPGAGKSTLVNGLIQELSKMGKRIAVLAIDPSSPFNKGSLLGDRIRMSSHFNDPKIYIRSMASRGALGGLSEKAIEVSDVLRSFRFDIILIETVGVGQSEVDIMGLVDQTVVVLVPESGDEIQHVKSGLMEIADIYVINKADRIGADIFASKLSGILKHNRIKIPVLKTIADRCVGVNELVEIILQTAARASKHLVNSDLLYEKAWRLIQQKRMRDIDKKVLLDHLAKEVQLKNFNLYSFVEANY